MIDTKRIHEIKDTIKETSEISLDFFKREFEKFDSKLGELLVEYDEEVTKVNRKIAKAITDLNAAQKEHEEILEVVKANKGKLKELDTKTLELEEKEESLLDLHKVLTNKGKMLDAKEKILETKERRVDGRG